MEKYTVVFRIYNIQSCCMNIHNITACMQHDILNFVHDLLHQCYVDASKQILRKHDVTYKMQSVL